MRSLAVLICVFFLASCGGNSGSAERSPSVQAGSNKGEELFKSKCYQCHRCETDLTGPMIKGSLERWKDKKLLFEFIRNPQEVIKKDQYAAGLYKKYYQTFMNPFPELTDDDIQAILDYCK